MLLISAFRYRELSDPMSGLQALSNVSNMMTMQLPVRLEISLRDERLCRLLRGINEHYPRVEANQLGVLILHFRKRVQDLPEKSADSPLPLKCRDPTFDASC